MDSNSELELGLKRQRTISSLQEGRDTKEVSELVDIISLLPNHVIERVLSCLETKEAIKTCVLSSRWRNLWKGITCIQLEGYRSDPEKFSNLVEHVLQNCSSTDFLAFELVCPLPIDLSRLNTWIGSIVSRKIKRLVLRANYSPHMDYELPELPLPQFILSCTTLVYLKLDCFDIQIPDSVVCFPCLKKLDLHVVFPDNGVVVNQLLSICPVLEELYLFGFMAFEIDFHDELKIDVTVTTLRRFILHLRDVGDLYRKKHVVIIDTPNLEYLSIDDDSFTKYVVKNLAWISNVFVNYEAITTVVDPEYRNHILELFKGIFATELLTLFWNTVNVLESALSYTWPTFPYLRTLIVHSSAFSGWACFSKILHCAPFLEFLVLDLEGINDVDNRPSGDHNALYQWTEPNTVPKCLEHLEIIGIQYFEGHKDELQVVEYLLKNAKMLEHMLIAYESENRSEEVVQKLLTSPRASKSCEVELYERLRFENDIKTELTNITIWGF